MLGKRSTRTSDRGEEPPALRTDRRVSHRDESVGVSIFHPPASAEPLRGVYLHVHGGSWILGAAAWHNDERLLKMARELRMAIVSVEYRLAPEAQWPQPVDDCVVAASWLAEHARAEFGTGTLVIGGESAGAHLCVLAMLRLRNALGLAPNDEYPYRAANLV